MRALAITAGCACLLLAGTAARAQLPVAPTAAAKANPRPKPHGANLAGVLVISNRSERGMRGPDMKPLAAGSIFTDWAAQQRKVSDPALDPGAACLPNMPRHMGYPYPMQIVQDRGVVVILFEAERVFRIVYTDERPFPDDGDTPWLGNSIGHWEGATLVVETRNINPKAWLDGEGTPISEDIKITERIRKIDGGKSLEVVMKIEDPKVFKQPVFQRFVYNYKPDWELKEYLCNEGNRDDALRQVPGQEGALKVGGVKAGEE